MSLHTWHCQGISKPNSGATFTLNSHWGRNAKQFLHLCTQDHFSRVRLFVTLETVACQISLSGREAVSRQEYWSVLANTGCYILLDDFIPCCPSCQLPSVPGASWHHLHTWPSQGQTQALQGSLRSNPQWTIQCRGRNKTTIETQEQCG